MAQNVKFFFTSDFTRYQNLETKDSLALYFIEDTNLGYTALYKGDALMAVGSLASEMSAGLMSLEDKKNLDELVASGGLDKLIPVDGTITIADAEDGKKTIGVAISEQENNMLTIVDGGLFVAQPQSVSVPEYTIEKQSTAEDGYSISYKLKKTDNGVESYVGDTINIAKDLVLHSVVMQSVTEADVPYEGAAIGDFYLEMIFNDSSVSHLYVPMKDLVDVYTAGECIEITNGTISVKLAENAHGLAAVDGSLTMLLATAQQDGAMSKEDKALLDSIATSYVTTEGLNTAVAEVIELMQWGEI